MKKQRDKAILKFLIILSPLIVFTAFYFGAKFFSVNNSVSTCMTYRFLHIYCPACGMTRSVIALMNGDIFLSVRQNVFTLIFLLTGFVFYIWYILGLFGVKFRLIICNTKFLFGILIVWFIYGISRNFIPFIAPI